MGKTVEVASLNLGGSPEAILSEVRRLATVVQTQKNTNAAAERSGVAATGASIRSAAGAPAYG